MYALGTDTISWYLLLDLSCGNHNFVIVEQQVQHVVGLAARSTLLRKAVFEYFVPEKCRSKEQLVARANILLPR